MSSARIGRSPLSRIATGASLSDALDAIVRAVEAEVPDAIAAICLVSDNRETLNTGSAHGLPADYNQAVDGLAIGPSVGSCGTAAYRGEPVFVTDIEHDPLWDEFKDVAAAFHLRACWSTPIMSRDQSLPTHNVDASHPSAPRVLGTLALYFREPRSPTPEILDVIQEAEHLACIAIEVHQNVRELRAQELRFRTFVDHAADAFFLIDNFGKIVDVNRQACEGLGYEREDLIGATTRLFDAALTEQQKADLGARVLRGETPTFESVHRRKDGSTFPVEIRSRGFETPAGTFRLSLVRDISERRKTEAALQESQEAFRRTQALTHVGTWTFQVQTGLFSASEEAWNICGLSPEMRPHDELTSIVHPEDSPQVQAAWARILAGQREDIECRIVVRGRTRWLSIRCAPTYDEGGTLTSISGFAQDVTGRRDLEEQLRRAQKMEAIGRLAGGIAHDFNNLLTIINGFSAMLLAELPPEFAYREDLAAIRDAGKRAANLTSRLLTLGRKAIIAPKPIDLNALVSSLAKMLERLIGEHITLVTKLWPGIEAVVADFSELEQVIMNLVLNARDAMPLGGTLTIETAEVRASDIHSSTSQPTFEKFVRLSISDTGEGMSDEVKLRLFEPFFTTKGTGKGTGLGLATVYGIVSQAGGRIKVESTPGLGSTFVVLLPACGIAESPTETETQRQPAPKSKETILLVEDEPGVRRLAERALQRAGYSVITASSGEEALEVEEGFPGKLHLLLTDVVMPGINGRELADALKPRRPRMKILYMSGYTDDEVVRCGILAARDAFLQKPFSPSDLATKVRALLEAETADSPPA